MIYEREIYLTDPAEKQKWFEFLNGGIPLQEISNTLWVFFRW